MDRLTVCCAEISPAASAKGQKSGPANKRVRPHSSCVKYVAQVAMGYDQAQTLRAIREAEAYPGPSIIIAYCPCLEHGIKAGMGCTQTEMKKAVECGYWHLYRYDPRLAAAGKNPFQLDSPEPDTDKMMEYLKGENRYASLANNFPGKAEAMYKKTIRDAKERYSKYKKMAESW